MQLQEHPGFIPVITFFFCYFLFLFANPTVHLCDCALSSHWFKCIWVGGLDWMRSGKESSPTFLMFSSSLLIKKKKKSKESKENVSLRPWNQFPVRHPQRWMKFMGHWLKCLKFEKWQNILRYWGVKWGFWALWHHTHTNTNTQREGAADCLLTTGNCFSSLS